MTALLPPNILNVFSTLMPYHPPHLVCYNQGVAQLLKEGNKFSSICWNFHSIYPLWIKFVWWVPVPDINPRYHSRIPVNYFVVFDEFINSTLMLYNSLWTLNQYLVDMKINENWKKNCVQFDLRNWSKVCTVWKQSWLELRLWRN